MTAFIDFHCHIDLYPDPPALIAECDRLGIRTLAVTTTPKAWPQNKKWTEASTHVRPALGLHPQVVAEREHELPLFEQYLSEARYVGEVGLDAGPQHYRSFDAQLRVFRRVLELCALHPGRVLSVHSVRATSKLLDAVEELLPADRGTLVLHWFSGTKAEARRAADLGCYFSINRVMLEGKRQDLVQHIPRDRLLTETDGPFTSVMDRPARPADIRATLAGLAAVLGVSIEELSHQLTSNLRTLVAER
jgi:TatD DNase family protein